MQACFDSVGFHGPAALTWLTLVAAGWPLPHTRDELGHFTKLIHESGLFDEAYYRSHCGSGESAPDAATHYALVGEQMGLRPSESFDPGYYRERNPDVTKAGMSLLLHYARSGRQEGRLGKAAWVLHFRHGPYDPTRANVILAVHETSRTGAPILGWNIGRLLAQRYNVFTIRMGDGELTPEFEVFSTEVHGPFPWPQRHPVDVDHSLRVLFGAHEFAYAIINSAEARLVVEACAARMIPTILLMHEFGSYVNPLASLRDALDWAGEIVFPAQVVRQAALDVHPILAARECRIIPQGMSVVPGGGSTGKVAPPAIMETLERARAAGDMVVLGAGSVQIRKGVDLFIGVAASVLRAGPARRVLFLWIGHGYQPDRDMEYSVYLREQIRRSGVETHVILMNEVSDLEPFYAMAEIFLLTSRLDPLPNVSIDAALRGIPIVCFRDASGIADLMLEDPDTAFGVVPYLDTERAAEVILSLAGDEDLHKRMAKAVRLRGEELFDMERYVGRIDRLGLSLGPALEQRRRDADTLERDAGFDQDMVLGLRDRAEPRRYTIARYLALAAARGWSDPPVPDTSLRRPAPGFNPRVWVAAHGGGAAESRDVDPFAEFVRLGRPAGPWQIDVLGPQTLPATVEPVLRVALHAHMFYPELVGELLACLGANRSPLDLLVSTDTPEKAEQLDAALRGWDRGTLLVRVMPNLGRDIGPMLTGFRDELGGYDLIGHVHAKRSRASGDDAMGDAWRYFLWENLLGGSHAMLDRVLAAFREQASLGLVFAADPHLVGWDANRPAAEALAGRLGATTPLPDAFDFPLGTMFWMRREVFAVLAGLQLEWTDYPGEPLAEDGTMLHALERLMPFVAASAGFSSGVTHVPGVTW